MEKKYLALVRESDFLDLYKYGEMGFNKDFIIEMESPIDELYRDKSIFDKLFEHANVFSKAFTYVILYYVKIKEVEQYQRVTIDEVRSVIPLDYESKVQFEDTYDSRIEFKKPIRESWCLELQKQWDFESCKQGVRYLWDMLNIPEPIEDYEAIVSDKMVMDMIDMMYESRTVSKDASIWSYALRYERHAFYPREKMIGYFMDCVHIVCNYINKKENLPDMVKTTTIYQFLNKNRHVEKYHEIVEMVKSSEQCSSFLNRIMEFVKEEPFFESIPLFLFYRNIFANQFKIDKDILGMLTYGKKFGKIFNIAIYLLGIYLGRANLIDCYYEWKRLPIFNKFKYRRYLDMLGINENSVDKNEVEIEPVQVINDAVEDVEQAEVVENASTAVEEPIVEATDSPKDAEQAEEVVDGASIKDEEPIVKATDSPKDAEQAEGVVDGASTKDEDPIVEVIDSPKDVEQAEEVVEGASTKDEESIVETSDSPKDVEQAEEVVEGASTAVEEPIVETSDSPKNAEQVEAVVDGASTENEETIVETTDSSKDVEQVEAVVEGVSTKVEEPIVKTSDSPKDAEQAEEVVEGASTKDEETIVETTDLSNDAEQAEEVVEGASTKDEEPIVEASDSLKDVEQAEGVVAKDNDINVHQDSSQEANVIEDGAFLPFPNELSDIIKSAFSSDTSKYANKRISYYCTEVEKVWKGKYNQILISDIEGIPQKTDTKKNWGKCRKSLSEYIQSKLSPKLNFGK